MDKCIKCSRELTWDEIGLTKKLINRGATEFMCIDCLAEKFKVTPQRLYEKIAEFKELGCLLFAD